MEQKTFTYTARCQNNPDKVATFTLQNGHVNIELGNALMAKIDDTLDTLQSEDRLQLGQVIQPAATGALNRLLQPVPLADFDAELKNGRLTLTAWLRSGGLRVAPIIVSWAEVDNPAGAQAFVDELRMRRGVSTPARTFRGPFDYWASWLVVAAATIALPVVWYRRWRGPQYRTT